MNSNPKVVYKYNLDGTYTGTNFDTSTETTDPWGITSNTTNFLITDIVNDEVYIYSLGGVYAGRSFDTAGSGNSEPLGITTNNTFIWITDEVDGLVYKYYQNGTYTGNSFDISIQDTARKPITNNATYFWIAGTKVTQYYMVNPTSPNITTLNQYPLNATAYLSTNFYYFNATIVNNLNNVDDVRFEFNNINYTPVNVSGASTIFNITLPIQLGAGVYTYRWIANDSSNNKNVTTNYTTVVNVTSVVNLTLNDFDRNITIQAGKTFYINATLLTGAYSGARLNLTMNNTQLNFSETGNLSHTLTLNKKESGVNFTIFYSGNQNFSASTETWFVEVAGVNVTLINPSNGTNSTGLSYTFGANVSTSEGDLDNSTLFIWNSTGGRVYNETNTETGVSAIRNITRTFADIQATFQNYKWNYFSCNNESSCSFSEKNYSFTIYSTGKVNSLSETRYILAENTSIEAYVETPSTGLDYCNFTVRIPSGANIINNINGSLNGNIWNSSSFFINETGQHQMNATCRDSTLGNLISKQANFTANYSIAYSPVNITL
ncbi:MAG: hypothetical protein AABY22_10060, partial [Nanoarchaeota archaeon]